MTHDRVVQTTSPEHTPGHTPSPSLRRRLPSRLAVVALVAVTAVACGSDDGESDATATDTGTSSSASTSPTATATGTATATDTATSPPSASESTNGDPVPSPVIDKAAKDAIDDGFPALVPSGVPAGWTVTKATYSPKRGGIWRIEMTNPDGAPVTLAQSKKRVGAIVNEYFPDGQPSGTVDFGQYGTGEWTAYTATDAAALAKGLSGTAAVVVGPDQVTVVAFADQLLTAEDSGSVNGG